MVLNLQARVYGYFNMVRVPKRQTCTNKGTCDVELRVLCPAAYTHANTCNIILVPWTGKSDVEMAQSVELGNASNTKAIALMSVAMNTFLNRISLSLSWPRMRHVFDV